MIIRKETLQAVLPATTKDDTRYFLKAILVEPSGRCIATNGHIMLLATDEHQEPDADYPAKPGIPEFKSSPEVGVLLPSDMAEGLIKAMPKGKRSTIPILNGVQIGTNGEEGFNVVATDLESVRTGHIQADGKDGTFPKYERVLVPADRPHLKVSLSTEVLKALIKSAEAASDTKLTTITFEIPTETKHQGHKPHDCSFSNTTYRYDHQIPDDAVCEKCGQTKAEHVGAPDGTIAGPIRVTCGTSIKVEGVVMPCRV